MLHNSNGDLILEAPEITWSDLYRGWYSPTAGIVTDPEKQLKLDGVRPRLSPIEFKLLFTAQERVAIKASTDLIVQDFFEIVNDPRLTFVDLQLSSTIGAINYLVSLTLLTAPRAAEILNGTQV